MTETIKVGPIAVDKILYDFVTDEALPGTGIDASAFWTGFAALLENLAPRNAALLAKRDRLQALIDDWHRAHPGANFAAADYKAFLVEIGYLVPEKAPFSVSTAQVDPENRDGGRAAIGGSGQ